MNDDDSYSYEQDFHSEEVDELNAKIETTLKTISIIDNEKNELQMALQISKTENEAIKLQLEESKIALEKQVESSLARETQLVRIEEQWRARVENERRELEQARKDPEEVTSHPLKEKYQESMKEQENLKTRFHLLDKEFQVYVTEKEIELSNAIKNSEIVKEGRINDAKRLCKKVDTVMTENAEYSSKIKSLEAKVKELQNIVKQKVELESDLKQEMQEVMSTRHKDTIARFQNSEKLMKEVHDLQTANALLEIDLRRMKGDSEIALEAFEVTKVEHEKVSQLLKEVEQDNIQWQDEVEKKDRIIADVKDELVAAKKDYGSQIKSLQARFQEERDILEQQIESLQKKVEELNLAQRKYRLQEVSAREKANRENQIPPVKHVEIETESTKLLLRNAELEVSLSQSELDLKESTQKQHLLANENQFVKEKCQSLEDLLEKTIAKCTHLQNELNDSTDAKNTTMNDNSKLEDTVAELRGKLKETTKLLDCEMQERKNAQALAEKTQKRAHRYKEKALDSHAKNVLLKSMHKKDLL